MFLLFCILLCIRDDHVCMYTYTHTYAIHTFIHTYLHYVVVYRPPMYGLTFIPNEDSSRDQTLTTSFPRNEIDITKLKMYYLY